MTPQKCRVLYVDDEPAYGRLFSRGMEDDDRFSIITATSGEEALRILQDCPVQIVLTDLLMPRMDGLHLLEEIKRCWPAIFVLMLTGVDSADKAVKAMKAGAYDYILKPLDIAMVRLQLGKILQHRHCCRTPCRLPVTTTALKTWSVRIRSCLSSLKRSNTWPKAKQRS
jgi:Response regulator containing CheY-like receiver, AAA-type ATPase, and DNA-binding domains